MGRNREENREYMRRYRERRRREQNGIVQPFDQENDLPFNNWQPVGTLLGKWSSQQLIVPTGLLSNKPFILDQWQIDFLNQAFQVRESGLCIARKNGKSGLIAVLLLCFLVGPLVKRNWRAVVCSVKGELAKELRYQIIDIAQASNLAKDLKLHLSPTPGHIIGKANSRVDFLSADKSSGHAVGADLALVDELGLFTERNRGLVNALYTSISGRNGRFIGISIKGHGPYMQELKDRADLENVHYREFVPQDGFVKLDDDQIWHDANPGLKSGIKSIEYMRDAAMRAVRSPANTNDFLAYDLNLPHEPTREIFCTPSQWAVNVVKELPERKGRCWVGLDLGGSSSMTALAAYWPLTGRLEAFGAFPDNPPLAERSIIDAVGNLYEQMWKAGLLLLFPGRVTPVAGFLQEITDIFLAGVNVAGVAADRYRQSECLQALEQVGLSWPCEWRGQGFVDGSEDVRLAKKVVLQQKCKVSRSLLIEHAISESSIIYDPAGNPKLDKARHKGRIDALSAVVLALSLGERHSRLLRKKHRYVGAV